MALQSGAPPKPRKRAKRRGHADPVTPELRAEVLALDCYRCVAPLLGATDACRDRWGQLAAITHYGEPSYNVSALTLDHVRDEPMMGKRAPSDIRHCVTVCWSHHLGGWATAHRPALRRYLQLRSRQIAA